MLKILYAANSLRLSTLEVVNLRLHTVILSSSQNKKAIICAMQ
jgi:hypothetical protein